MANGQDFNIWEGVYEAWGDAPQNEGAFNSDRWIDSQGEVVRKDLDDIRERVKGISDCAISHDYILPAIVAVAGNEGGCTRVLDFGGGMASSYASVRSSVEEAAGSLEFHVVESAGICDRASQTLGDESRLYFHANLPADGEKFDVIHAGRSFQYVDDWPGMLRSFAGMEPRYLILAGALAGDIRPFVSIQNYYGYKIRVRFLNLDELLDEARKLGFTLIYKSLHKTKRLGKEGPLPMENFPAENRLEYPCQLLFRFRG